MDGGSSFPSAQASKAISARQVAWVFVAILLGLFLRVLFFDDMEYKDDERWTFEKTQAVGRGEPFPWLGMPTSVTVKHPGGSVWVFLGLAWIAGANTPDGLGLACMVLNSLALGLLAVFAFVCVPDDQREPWLWAVALAAVNPIQVVLHRKIWPPSIMPFFVMVFLFAWWYRQRRAGAFAWGLTGAGIGQIHPVGSFLAAGFAVWALLWDRTNIRWRYWLTGSVLGGLTIIPWLLYASQEIANGQVVNCSLLHALRGLFYFRWFTEPFGLQLRPYLGSDFADFLRRPVIAGQATYLLGAAYVGLIVLTALILVRASLWLWDQRGHWGKLWRGAESATAFTVGAALWGFGLVFTLTFLPFRHYYMVLTFPFLFIWLARLVLASQSVGRGVSGRALLFSLCGIHFLIALGHLVYIHENRHRPLGGEYGVPYSAQASENVQARGANRMLGSDKDVQHESLATVTGYPGVQRRAEHSPSD